MKNNEEAKFNTCEFATKNDLKIFGKKVSQRINSIKSEILCRLDATHKLLVEIREDNAKLNKLLA